MGSKTISNKKYFKYLLSTISFLVIGLAAVISATQIPKISTWLVSASKTQANLTIDFQSKPVPLKPIWRNLAQGGESSAFNPQGIQAKLKNLAPEYVRIDHLYDFYINVQRDQQNQFTFDFSQLDQLLSQIHNIGATPFISLSYTPAVLNADIIGIPANYDEYSTVIQKTIEHISGINNQNIKNVYYEVWNEPDLFGQWKTYGNKNYLDLYRYAAQAASSATNTQPFRFGGPATTKLYKNWTLGLVKQAIDHNLRLDFLSWHFYDSNPDSIKVEINQLKDWMESYPDLGKRLEIIVSEWGIDSNNNPAYDNQISAAHLVATVSQMIPVVDRAFTFEIEDGKGPQEYWGRWGLYTHRDYDNSIKPRGEAIALLNHLGESQIFVNGQGGWVKAIATKKNSSLDIIIANYDLTNSHAELVPLTITNIPSATYTVDQTYLGRGTTTQTINITSSVFASSIPMPPNAVLHLSIRPAGN